VDSANLAPLALLRPAGSRPPGGWTRACLIIHRTGRVARSGARAASGG